MKNHYEILDKYCDDELFGNEGCIGCSFRGETDCLLLGMGMIYFRMLGCLGENYE